MSRDKIKKEKICLVCGEKFRATGKANVCSGACRTKLARGKKKNIKPGFCLLVKANGQELPEWIAVKTPETGQKSTKTKNEHNPATEPKAPKNEENLTYFQKRQRGLI